MTLGPMAAGAAHAAISTDRSPRLTAEQRARLAGALARLLRSGVGSQGEEAPRRRAA